jgi:hypothetical protein
MVLGALADNKSDDEIARMREQAMAVARIVIRTYFGAAPAASSPGCAARPFEGTQDSLVEQDDGTKLNGRRGQRRPHRVRRRPVSQVANSRGERRPRGERTTQS